VGKTETQEGPSEHQQTLFDCEGDGALARVPHGGCGVSILGDTQKPSGYGPGQLAPGVPGSAGLLDHLTSRGPLQPQLLCGSVN